MLFQEKNPSGLMPEVQMNEFSVNFEGLYWVSLQRVPKMTLFL